MLTGFGAAIAATIAAWMVGGLLLNDPQLPQPGQQPDQRYVAEVAGGRNTVVLSTGRGNVVLRTP